MKINLIPLCITCKMFYYTIPYLSYHDNLFLDPIIQHEDMSLSNQGIIKVLSN